MVAVLLWVMALQAVALLVQGVLAGLALTGVGGSVIGLHMAVGTMSLLLAVVQVGIALLIWWQGRGLAWLVAATVVFLVADGVQAFAGSAHLLTLHLPLGVALFGATIALSIWSRELPRNGMRARQRARAVAPG